MEDIIKFRKRLTEYVEILHRNQDSRRLDDFCIARHFNRDLVDKLGLIYIENMAELVVPEFLEELVDFGVISPNNRKPIYSDRYVIPIRDMSGLVMGLVGYSLSDKARYMYANTKYFERNDILYGMEKYEKCLEAGYIVVTEGITDCFRIKQLGYELCMSTAGAHRSLFMMQMLDMIPIVLFIPDRDRAGDGTKEYWKTNNYGRLLIPFIYKDLDEYACSSERSANNLKEYVDMALNYMRESLDKGIAIVGEEMPIYVD